MDRWLKALREGRNDAAWNWFLERYRKLVFSAIRHYVQDYDDVMDVFAQVCEALREDNLRRLRAWADQTHHRARFSTWLVTVVHHLTVDWFRHRDGRRRLSAIAKDLPQLQRAIFETVFVDRRSHVEAYELIKAASHPTLTFREFLVELRATYRTVTLRRRGTLLGLSGKTLSVEELELAAAPDTERFDGADLRERLKGLLEALSPEDRVAVELYVMEELPAATVARMLDLPNAKAVYNRVYRALGAMRAELDKAGVSREDL